MNSTRLTSSTYQAARGRPKVLLIGQADHCDFRDAVELLHASAELTVIPDITLAITELTRLQPRPELMLIMQSRPDAIGALQVKRVRRAAPLAGAIALLGSWSEGYGRTGRPWPGTQRLYWHEFAPWWRRQLTLRADGRCPDWARASGSENNLRVAGVERQRAPSSPIRKAESALQGLIVLVVPCWETADVLGDVLANAGYATVWQPSPASVPVVRGAIAGIWEGGQLDDQEAGELAAFCRQMAKEHASVITLLDFPRRDSVKLASELGAAAVLGKSCLNETLVATLEQCTERVALSEKFPHAA